MRYGSLCSALLHGGLVALLLVGLDDAGGSPSLGAGGGAMSVDVVVSFQGSIPTPDATAASETSAAPLEETSEPVEEAVEETVEPVEVATAAPQPPPPTPAAAAAPPPPPNSAAVAETFDLPPVPVGPSPNTPNATPVAEPTDEVVPMPSLNTAKSEPAPVYDPRPREPRLEEEPVEEPAEQLVEAPPSDEPPPETPPEMVVETPPEPVAEPIETAEPVTEPPPPDVAIATETNNAPPEKPTKKVEVPAPKLVKQAEPTPQVAEKPVEAAAEPDVGEEIENSAAAQAGADQQAALPGADAEGSAGNAGAAGGATLGMSEGELQDYAGQLLAWLDKHKRYPDPARRRKEEGVVVVEFAIDGQGRVLSHKLLGASGHELLDVEAEALLSRASPVPAPPDGTGRSFQVPIVFALR